MIKRLIKSYAVGPWTGGNLKAVWIAIAVPGDFIDIEVLSIRIIREILFSRSIEIQVGDCSNAIPYICSE